MGQNYSTIAQRRYTHLKVHERYQIEAFLVAKKKPCEIAVLVGKDRSTIYREIQRGQVKRLDSELVEKSVYRANVAQQTYDAIVSKRRRSLKIEKDPLLMAHITTKIKADRYSPDVIVGTLLRTAMQFAVTITTKTLYNYISRGIFAGVSNADLWRKRFDKKQPYRIVRRVNVHNRLGKSIESRPQEANARIEPGHWEGDTVKSVSGDKSGFLTLTERVRHEQVIVKVARVTQSAVCKAIDDLEREIGAEFSKKFKTITFDNGPEFLDWETLERSCLDKAQKRTSVYFAHPYSSWERGTNENHNGIIRRFFPKGTRLSKISRGSVAAVCAWMNNYPRRSLGYRSPNELVSERTKNKLLLS